MGMVKRWVSVLLALALAVVPVSVKKSTNVKAKELTQLTDGQVSELLSTYETGDDYSRVSVHDPSIVVGYYEGSAYTSSTKVYGEQNSSNTRKEIYFIFGSHRAFAYSLDLKSWKPFTNNINSEADTLFAKGAEWSKRGDSVYQLTNWIGGNLWAPDVIWNPDYNNGQGAWMMYMSVNGCSWNSSIALLTSDSLNGNWTYRGTVIYSGFDNGTTYDYTATDYKEVTGDTSLADRYLAGAWQWEDNGTKCVASRWNTSYGAHAIDPCVISDGGKLWMTYGSWSGGIYMIQIDKSTGLRDKTRTYSYKFNESDPYMGLKIAGGDFASGEASYIQKIGSKYYLFVTNGGLASTGGYSMRTFSSASLTGPYKDMSGEDARYLTNGSVTVNNPADGTYTVIRGGNEGNINGTVGNKLMSYYQWGFMNYGFMAQGHNSAFVDDDGRSFLVYHSRYTNGGENHQVRVHQIFQAKNGGLVTAPFEYGGEKLETKAYENESVVGSYQILTMGDVNYAAKQCVTEKTIRLNEDGTVTGEYTGTWEQASDGPYLTMSAGGTTYQGVFVVQKKEETKKEVMCLSLVGDNDISIWGYGSVIKDDLAVAEAVTNSDFEIDAATYEDIHLPDTGLNNVKVTWESSDPEVLSEEGKIGSITADTPVTLTATFTKGNYTYKKEYETTVYAGGISAINTDNGLEALYDFENGVVNQKNNSQSGILTYQGSAKTPVLQTNADRISNVLHLYATNEGSHDYAELPNPLQGKNVTSATVSMWVQDFNSNVFAELWSFFDGDKNRLFLTKNIFLGYNDGNDHWFDCNNGSTPTNALQNGQWTYVTVSFGKTAFSIYLNGVLTYTKTQNAAFSGSQYDEEMAQRVLNLVNSSSKFYLGYGGFWRTAEANIDNVRIYSKSLAGQEVTKLYQEEMSAWETAKKTQEEQKKAEEQAKAKEQENQQSTNTQQETAAQSDASQADVSQQSGAVSGKTYTVGKLKYKVTSLSGKKVTVSGVKSKKLTSAVVPATVKIKGTTFKVTVIGANAFAKCTKLKKVTVGKNVTQIGKKAFSGCKKLNSIVIQGSALKKVGANAFKGISKKAKIKVPAKMKKKYKKLLKKKGQKSTVKIG